MGFLETIFSCFYDKKKQKQRDAKSEQEEDAVDMGDPKVISNIAQFPSVKQMRNIPTIQEEKDQEIIDDDQKKKDTYGNSEVVQKDEQQGTIDKQVDDTTIKEIQNLFPELTVGFHTTEGEWNEISQPIRCTYKEYDTSISDYRNEFIGEELPPSINGKVSMPVEYRGITLRQLRAVHALVLRLCKEKKMMSSIPGEAPWPITDPNKVTLYDINANIIIPYTKPFQTSFVEALPSTAGTQNPRWFMSHFWGEPFLHTMACIETLYQDFSDNFQPDSFARGGGMTLDSPIWICAFANNQHDLSDITENPEESGFAKALEVANYRTVSIVDEKGIVFTRVWCVEELYLTHLYSQEQKTELSTDDDEDKPRKGQIWAIYTAYEHENDDGETKNAIGLVAGGTTVDGGDGSYIAAREAEFPMKRILQSRNINIQTAQASVESDRRHILNSICKRKDLNADPFEAHENYDMLNNAVKGAFACSLPALRGSLKEGEEEWKEMIQVMSTSITRDPMRFNFEDGYGWDDLEIDSAIQLIDHLPHNIEGLELLYAPFGASFYNAVANFIENRATNLKSLEIWHSTCGSGKDAVLEASANLARGIGKCDTIVKLELFQTDLFGSLSFLPWFEAIKENKSLKQIRIAGLNNGYMIEDIDEDTYDEEDETVENPDDFRQRIYWKEGLFPNAMMKEEEVTRIKEASTCVIEIDQM